MVTLNAVVSSWLTAVALTTQQTPLLYGVTAFVSGVNALWYLRRAVIASRQIRR